MKAMKEYNECETYFHGVNQSDFDALLAEANGKVEDITLYGRVFNPERPFEDAELESDYENVRGAGYIYATDYANRDNATPGASAQAGVTLMLGYDGVSSVEPISKSGEILVPVEGYKVLGIVEE